MIVIAKISEHPKVPEVEQILSAGAAATKLLTAAHALGYAGIWRTGSVSFSRMFMSSIGLQANEKIVGFIYLGTTDGRSKPLPDMAVDDFFQAWRSVG